MLSDPSREIRERLRELLGVYSQTEIARRTGIPRSSISRYLADQRIPADVASKFTRHLGVSPDWLLTGNGTRFVSELSEADSEAVAPLLEILERLLTVSEAIKELPDDFVNGTAETLLSRIDEHDQVRAQLKEDLQPAAQALADQVRKLMGQGQFDRAVDRLNLAKELVRLTGDFDWSFTLRNLESILLVGQGRLEESLEIRRRLFRESMAMEEMTDTVFAAQHNFVVALALTRRQAEALRTAEILVRLNKQSSDLRAYWWSVVDWGVLEVEGGQIRSGLDRLLSGLPKCDEYYREGTRHVLAHALVLRGTQSTEEALSVEIPRIVAFEPRRRARSAFLWLLHCIAEENEGCLQTVYEAFAGDWPSYSGSTFVIEYAPYLVRALRGEGETVFEEWKQAAEASADADGEGEVKRAEQRVLSTQLARITGSAAAPVLLEETRADIEAIPRVQEMMLLFRWIHGRNAVRLVSAESSSLIRAAQDGEFFLQDYVDRGYLIFEKDLEERR